MADPRIFDISIGSIMIKDAITVQITDDAEYAVMKMNTYRVSSVVICDGKLPVGMLTESDVTDLISEHAGGLIGTEIPLAQLITGPVMVVAEAEMLGNILSVMCQVKFRSMPVVNEARELVGVVSQTDMFKKCVSLLMSDD